MSYGLEQMEHSDLRVGMQVRVVFQYSHYDPPVGTVLTVTSIDDDGTVDFRVTWDGDDNYLMNTMEVVPHA